MLGRIRDYEPPDPNNPNVGPEKSNRGWLRMSDDQVEEVGLKTVLSEVSGTFMLYYERVLVDSGSSSRVRKASLSRKTPPPGLHVDTTAGAKMQPYIHVTMSASAASSATELPGSAVSAGRSLRQLPPPVVTITSASSPRSSEETITQDHVRPSRSSSPKPGEEDEDPGTPKAASASQELPPVEFPKSAMSRSSSTASGRIVRNVTLAPLPTNPSRSRTTSGASSRSAASASPIVITGPPLSGPSTVRSYGTPLVMETDPSPLPPGSARTKARFTPPATPLVLPTPINLVPEPREESKEEFVRADERFDERDFEPLAEPEPEVIQLQAEHEPEPEHEPAPEPEPEFVHVATESEVYANGSAEVAEEKEKEKDKAKDKKKKDKSAKSGKKSSKVNGGLRT